MPETEVYPMPALEALANIPQRFTRRPQWVNYRLIEKPDGGYDKPPFDSRTGRGASSTDLMSWVSFERAREAVEGGKYDGVGFVLCSADPFVAVDLDNVRNPETGEISERARRIMGRFEDAYVEVSVSGKGVHIVTRGRYKGGHNRKGVEVYGQDRFIAMTGVIL